MPNPVRPSGFIALNPAHTRFAVMAAPSDIPAFGACPEAPRDVLWVDLRDQPARADLSRLGATRSGFFDGKLLDGVGPTTLATRSANRAPPLDAARAIRELVHSRWASKRAASSGGEVIAPCEGVLFGLRGATPEATTIRDGERVRFSNLVWLAYRIDLFRKRSESSLSLARFVRVLLGALGGGAQAAAPPSAVAHAILRAFDRAFTSVERLARAGLVLHDLRPDDLSADGVVLRLRRSSLASCATVAGLVPLLSIVRAFRELTWFFRSRFAAIAEAGPPVSSTERDFCAAIVTAFEEAREHPLFHRERILDRIVASLPRAAHGEGEQLAEAYADIMGGGSKREVVASFDESPDLVDIERRVAELSRCTCHELEVSLPKLERLVRDVDGAAR